MIPFPSNQILRQPMSQENVTGLLRQLQDFFQIKIENIYLFKIIIIKKQGNVFKTRLCRNFLLLPKNSDFSQTLGGGGPYAYDGNCNVVSIIYQAEVTSQTTKETYIGLCDTPFKLRYRNHTSSFRSERYRNATELSKHVWNLKDQNIQYDIKWRKIKHA